MYIKTNKHIPGDQRKHELQYNPSVMGNTVSVRSQVFSYLHNKIKCVHLNVVISTTLWHYFKISDLCKKSKI